MNRRQMMATLGAAAATPAFFSLTSAQAAGSDHAQQSWMTHSMRVSSLSLLASRAAIKQATDDHVTQFAKWEAAEQNAYGAILRAMKSGSSGSGDSLNKPTDADAMKVLDAHALKELSGLKNKSGRDFDKAYVQAELSGHKKLLDAQQKYLKEGQNEAALFFAKIAQAYIEQHIDELQMLKSKMS